MKRIIFLGILLCICGSTGCRRRDVRTAEIDVPGLKNRKCEEIILKKLLPVAGIMPDIKAKPLRPLIYFDIPRRKVTITYNSMQVAVKNLEHHIASAGFDAGPIPANADAFKNLPPECK